MVIYRQFKRKMPGRKVVVQMDYKERVREQDLQKIQQLRIFDDEFLKEVFDGNTEATELLLNIVFDRKI